MKIHLCANGIICRCPYCLPRLRAFRVTRDAVCFLQDHRDAVIMNRLSSDRALIDCLTRGLSQREAKA